MYIKVDNVLLNTRLARIMYIKQMNEHCVYLIIEMDNDKRDCGYPIRFSSYDSAVKAIEFITWSIMRGERLITVNGDAMQ